MASPTPDCARKHGRASIGTAAAVLIAVALGGCSARTFSTPAGVQPAGTQFQGEHYIVICHFDCGPAGRGALEAAEAAWRAASQLMGPSRQPLERPLSIHLYGTYQEYEIVEMELTHGQFRGNRAMTHPATLSAHLATQPYPAAPVLREFGLTANTLRVVAHEALHLAALASHPKSRWLPTWLEEGLATWTETQVVVELGRAPSITEEPVSSTRAHLLRQSVERGSLPHLRDLLSVEISMLPLVDQYAFYQYFFDFLKTRYGANLTQQLYAVDDIEGRGDSYTRRVTESLLGTGNGAVDRLNSEFRAYVNELRPTWVETRRTFSAIPNSWVQVGFDDGAQIWRWEPVLEPPAELSGRAQIFDDADASVLLALQDGGFISVTLRASGSVTIVQHGPFGVAPRILAEGSSAPPRNSDHAFRIRIERDGLAVWVSEAAQPLRLVGTGMRPTGRWGLAASPRGNVVWRNVRNTRGNAPAP